MVDRIDLPTRAPRPPRSPRKHCVRECHLPRETSPNAVIYGTRRGGPVNLPPFEVGQHQPVLDQRLAARPAWRTGDLWSTVVHCKACLCAAGAPTIEFELEIWRRRPDLNRGWRFCRPLPYHLATAPDVSACGGVEHRIVPESVRHGQERDEEGESEAPAAANEGRRAPPPLSGGPSAQRAWGRFKGPHAREVKIGAGNGIRTRDFDLGKVALYH
jgi:hypothetical protein